MNASQNVAPHAVEFNTLKFEAAHGKQPRGTGNWAFCPAQFYDANDYLDHVQWFTGTYANAKKSARAFYSVQPDVFEFHEFFAELVRALDNVTEDHREKTLRKLVKMQQSRDGEAKLGNLEAAEAFAAAINRMLVENELNPSDIDYARSADDDPVIELPCDLSKYAIDKKRQRVAWQESLARIVAKAHLCTWLLRTGSNQIWFVGTKSHATVAEYVYGTLVPIANTMSIKEKYKYGHECFARDGNWKGVNGFREAWLDAFVKRIAERFDDARKAAVAEAVVDLPTGSESQALMRLDGALVRVQRYIDDKFKSRRSSASMLSSGRSTNAEGSKRGRAAADAMTIGRRGVTGGTAKKLLH